MKLIAMYDLEDNILQVFDNYKECADFFNTSTKVIQSYICRSKKGLIDKKRDTINNRWVRLFLMEDQKCLNG